MSFNSELQKLYPAFKIPNHKHAVYYIDLMQQYYPDLHWDLERVIDFRNQVEEENMSKVKMKLIDEVLTYFKDLGWDWTKVDHAQYASKFEEKNATPESDGRFYCSLDLREANWQAFKYIFNAVNLGSFPEFMMNKFDAHPALANSKSFRQFLLGNTNPKLLQKVQRKMISEIESQITVYLERDPLLVSRTSDEMIFEQIHGPASIHKTLSEIKSPHRFKTKVFTQQGTKNFNEHVVIRNTMTYTEKFEPMPLRTDLIGVSGNRFFIHFKTLLLKQELDERDLLFQNDKFLAQWILES